MVGVRAVDYVGLAKLSVMAKKFILGGLFALFLSTGRVSASETKNLPSAKPEKVGMSSDRLE